MHHDQALMTEDDPTVDFDARPPMPLSDYDQTVRRVNAGYELVLTLADSLLRALHPRHSGTAAISATRSAVTATICNGAAGSAEVAADQRRVIASARIRSRPEVGAC